MPYLNLSVAKTAFERWQQLSEDQRLTVKWVIVTGLVALVFWLSQKTMPENPTVFRYFVSLYAINSLVFFLIFQQYRPLGKTMLVFLVSLEIIVSFYYGFSYLSVGV